MNKGWTQSAFNMRWTLAATAVLSSFVREDGLAHF
jgi:hypothetical protein